MITRTKTGWQVSIQPGGRKGRRIRCTFALKELAKQFERQQHINHERISSSLGADITICELIDKFTSDYAKLRFKGFPDESYRLLVIRRFFEANNKPINEVKLADAEAFIYRRKSDGKEIGTINRDINTLKRIFSWAGEGQLIPFNPLQSLKHLKGAKVRCRWLDERECELLLASAKQVSQRVYEAVFFALNTGFRLDNIECLEVGDIKADFITARKTKSGHPYDIPISATLRTFIDTVMTKRSGFALDTHNLKSEFHKALELAGLRREAKDPMKVTFHTLRHTFASYWLQKGVPIYTVSKWLGHSSIKMTESVYGHLSRSHHKEEMQRFSGIGSLPVDTPIIPFPESASKSDGVDGIRTRGLCLDSTE